MSVIISGRNAVIEAIKAGREIEEIYIQERTNKDIIKLARERLISYVWMSKQEINKLLGKANQGVGAKVADYEYQTLDYFLEQSSHKRVIVMLDGIKDPHNLGAIMRSCDAFKVDGIIIPKNRNVHLNATVAKVSTGAIEYVPVVEVVNLHQTIRKLKNAGYWVAGTDMDGDRSIHEIPIDTDLVIVIGSEGEGMSKIVKDNCDFIASIPMNGHVNSLNASVSAALVLYDIFRRKGV